MINSATAKLKWIVTRVKSNIHLKGLAKLITDYRNKKVLFHLPSEIEQNFFQKQQLIQSN